MSLTESYDPEEDAYLLHILVFDIRLFERDGAKVAVDKISLELITGSKVDYSTELIGSQFKIVDNPAASSNCGYNAFLEIADYRCGASFDLDFSKQATAPA
jgi:Fe-S cluster assembly iron-binding protein IscA